MRSRVVTVEKMFKYNSELYSIVHFKEFYYMTIFASVPEREIQQFDWFLSGLELAVPERCQREFWK